ncbi:MAG: major capsid protein, partial [Actinomycetota bacterium]
ADQAPDAAADRSYARMVAAADVPGFSTGQPLESFADAARALEHRFAAYSQPGGRRGGKRGTQPIETVANGRRHLMRNYTRHGGVVLRREFPDDLRITSEADALGVIDHAASERRLPGGNLIESARRQVEQGRALTAAVGWCAPSEVIYDLCELESMDGILDVPEVQATRGGFQLPEDGGPDFSVIWDGIGDEGDTHLSEYDVEADTVKQCLEIPCPDFEEVRLGVDYFCLTGSLLQRRGYPEVVARFGRGAMVALAHKINQGVIDDIVNASTGPTVIPELGTGDDAASALLSAVELAIEDIRYRNRMPFAATLEVVLPHWMLLPIRAALARRNGVGLFNVSDAQILDAFATRRAMPRLVYDWQDSFSGQADGPGGANPLTELPDTVDFCAYPAGTWTKAVQDVINLDTVHDSSNLTNNQYTAAFVEDGWAVMQTCPDSRVYTATVDPAGIVACCSELS